MEIKHLSLAALLAFTSFNLHAEESEQERSGWLVGGMAGSGSVDIKSPTHTNNQDNVVTLGAYGDYIFNDWFALEVSLFVTEDLADNQAGLDEADLSVLSFVPKFSYKLNDSYSFYGKAGLAFMSYEEEYNNIIVNQHGYYQSWEGAGILLGAGMQLSFDNGIAVRIDYDFMQADLDADNYRYYSYAPDVDIDLQRISIGVHYQFE